MMYKGYLIDLDGTMFNGDAVIDGAREFIDRLNEEKLPYLFLTNNATRSKNELLEKFDVMGFKTSAHHIYTSAMAMAKYIEEHYKAPKVFVIGTDSFKATLEEVAELTDEAVDVVVMGLDPTITYDKIIQACRLIQNGAEFLATNPDQKIKSHFGFSPGNGAFVKLVSDVTGVAPTIIGKPEKYILEGALAELKLHKEDVAMIGDNYDTDILTGINGGVDTIHVNTGVHSTKDVRSRNKVPTHQIDNLNEWHL